MIKKRLITELKEEQVNEVYVVYTDIEKSSSGFKIKSENANYYYSTTDGQIFESDSSIGIEFNSRGYAKSYGSPVRFVSFDEFIGIAEEIISSQNSSRIIF